MQELHSENLVCGKEKHENGVGPQGVVDVTTEGLCLVGALPQERDHLAKVCASARIEECKVKLAESRGALVADVIRRLLNALGLTTELPGLCQRAPRLGPRNFRNSVLV